MIRLMTISSALEDQHYAAGMRLGALGKPGLG